MNFIGLWNGSTADSDGKRRKSEAKTGAGAEKCSQSFRNEIDGTIKQSKAMY
jgi:hypothetical protein